MTEQTDGLDSIAERLNFKRLGWHRHVNSETGEIALFPSVRHHTADSPARLKLENAWEQKALAQNAKAEAMERANRLADKPAVNTLAERKRIARGD